MEQEMTANGEMTIQDALDLLHDRLDMDSLNEDVYDFKDAVFLIGSYISHLEDVKASAERLVVDLKDGDDAFDWGSYYLVKEIETNVEHAEATHG